MIRMSVLSLTCPTNVMRILILAFLLADISLFAETGENLRALLPTLELKSAHFRNMMVMAAVETRFQQYSGILLQPPDRDPHSVLWLQATLVAATDCGCRSVSFKYNSSSNVLKIVEGSDHLERLSGNIKAVAATKVVTGSFASSSTRRLWALKDRLFEIECDTLEVARDFFGRHHKLILLHWYDMDRLETRSKILRVQTDLLQNEVLFESLFRGD